MKSTSLILVKLYKILKENKDLFLTILAYSLSNMTSKFSYSLKCANISPVFKGALLDLRKFLVTQSPLKMTKNSFYFVLKAPLLLKIFKFLS